MEDLTKIGCASYRDSPGLAGQSRRMSCFQYVSGVGLLRSEDRGMKDYLILHYGFEKPTPEEMGS
jgi:hypothetical protein